MDQSPRFDLNRADVMRWSNNALIFFAPAFLVFFTAIQSGATMSEALIALKVWGINCAVDLLRKFVAGNS